MKTRFRDRKPTTKPFSLSLGDHFWISCWKEEELVVVKVTKRVVHGKYIVIGGVEKFKVDSANRLFWHFDAIEDYNHPGKLVMGPHDEYVNWSRKPRRGDISTSIPCNCK